MITRDAASSATARDDILDTVTQPLEVKAICESERNTAYPTPTIKPVPHCHAMGTGSEDKQHQNITVKDTTDYSHAFTADDWVNSISESSSAPTHYNWVIDPLLQNCDTAGWLVTKPEEDVEAFYNAATGMFIGHTAMKVHQELADFAAHSTPRYLWAAFLSPWDWTCDLDNWGEQWELALRRCAKIFNGYPLDALPFRIPAILNHEGEYTVQCWDAPYR